MNKVTRIKNANYTTISNVFLRDKELSLKAKGLLATILSLPENWDFSIKGICATIKEGTTAVYSAIDELKERGYCKVVTNRNEKGMIVGNDYTFYEDPNMENLNMGNQSQINTNISLPNTKETYNKEINKEEKEIDKSISKNTNNFGLDMSFVDKTFLPIILEWLEYKKEKKQSYKQRGFNTLYKNFFEMCNGNVDVARKIVNQSMQNNYAGLFPLRQATKYAKQSLPIGMIIAETQEERNEKFKNEKGW